MLWSEVKSIHNVLMVWSAIIFFHYAKMHVCMAKLFVAIVCRYQLERIVSFLKACRCW